MDATPYGSGHLSLTCWKCAGKHTMAATSPVTDPFASDDPWQSLTPLQRGKLTRRWQRDELGEAYQFGRWSLCRGILAQDMRDWHQAQDERPQGLLISGDKGTGKSVALSLAMACLCARNEFDFAYYTSFRLSALLSGWQGGRYGTSGEDNPLHAARTCKYLFLDDMGTEYASPLAMAALNDLVEYRYARGGLFVACSNLCEDDLCAREGWERIVDRLQVNAFDWCEVGGPSMRRPE